MIYHAIKKWMLIVTCALLSQLSNAAELAGHYYLHGITEVGSEMLLKPDGTYQAILMYGAVDIESSGSWQKKDNRVELDATEKQPSIFTQLKMDIEDEKLRPQNSPLSQGYYQKD